MVDWTVVCVRGGSELKFREWCGKYGTMVYVPLGKYQIVPRRKHALVTIARPVFKNYVFTPTDHDDLKVVRAAPQLLWILTYDNHLCLLEESAIDEIRRREAQGAFDWIVSVKPRISFEIGQELVVKQGALTGRKGKVIRSSGSHVILDVGGKVVKMPLALDPQPVA